MTTPMHTDQQLREYVEALRGFYVHLAIYLVVNLMLFLIDMVTPGGPWFYWPLFGWGIAVLINAVAVFMSGRVFGPEWMNRKVDALRSRAAHAGRS